MALLSKEKLYLKVDNVDEINNIAHCFIFENVEHRAVGDTEFHKSKQTDIHLPDFAGTWSQTVTAKKIIDAKKTLAYEQIITLTGYEGWESDE